MSRLLIIFIIIGIFFSNSIAAVFKVGTTSTEITSSDSSTQIDTDIPTSSTGGNFESASEYPIIKRIINPNYKDFNLKNKPTDIEVKLQGCSRNFDNVLMKEIIDENFGNIYNIHVNIEDPFFSIKRAVYEKNCTKSIENKSDTIKSIIYKMGENYTYYNKSLYIKVPRLKSGENVIYDYSIMPNRSGIFDIVTIFRLNDSKWSDLEKRDTIEIRPPEVEITSETDRSSPICGDFLNVTYNILHKSGWSNDDLNVSLFFNNSDQYTIYYENKTKYDNGFVNLRLKPLERTKYQIKVIYNEAGKHPIPSLDIVGATVYQKEAEVNIISNSFLKLINEYGPSFSLIISLSAILISFYIGRKEQQYFTKLEGIYDNRLAEQEKINHSQKEEINYIKQQIEEITHQQDIDLPDDPGP
jgi:hypothetical protein